ncbi:MAG: transglutaminase-like cysteine peptidase [Gammaproteobacteria bacterium]|nr:transglutaminase-like cysteine peptidase [Gammaproteobacteria bacterium]
MRKAISLSFCVLMFGWFATAFAEEFDNHSNRIGPASLLEDWYAVVQRSEKEHAQIEACLEDESKCTQHMKSMRTLILRGRDLKPRQKLSLVNRFINKERRYTRDRRSNDASVESHVDQRQHWSTLLDFLEKGGDCEDYATSKYALLKLLGFKPRELRVLIVYDRTAREHHALTLVKNEELGLHLLDSDNAIYRVRPFHYRYVYSVNEESIWDHSLDREPSARRLRMRRSR